MIDLPMLMHKSEQIQATNRLIAFKTVLAGNVNMEKSEISKFVERLREPLETGNDEEFDAAGLAVLRKRINGGG